MHLHLATRGSASQWAIWSCPPHLKPHGPRQPAKDPKPRSTQPALATSARLPSHRRRKGPGPPPPLSPRLPGLPTTLQAGGSEKGERKHQGARVSALSFLFRTTHTHKHTRRHTHTPLCDLLLATDKSTEEKRDAENSSAKLFLETEQFCKSSPERASLF